MRTNQQDETAGWKPWRDKKLRRHVMFSLAVNAVAYTAVYSLVSQGVLGNWSANTAVSKAMAPVWLGINTLALTGRLIPTRGQAAKWLAYWVPSAVLGAIFLAFVIANFGLDSLEARVAVGVALFPVDHVVKRFIIFANGFFRKLLAAFGRAYLRLRTVMV